MLKKTYAFLDSLISSQLALNLNEELRNIDGGKDYNQKLKFAYNNFLIELLKREPEYLSYLNNPNIEDAVCYVYDQSDKLVKRLAKIGLNDFDIINEYLDALDRDPAGAARFIKRSKKNESKQSATKSA